MGDSVPSTTTPTDSSPPEQHWAMGRALLSAALFGFIGKSIGQWLGKNINNNVAEGVFKWSMGAFWAVLAAYSSLKASAVGHPETATVPIAKGTLAVEKKPDEPNETKVKTPLSLIEVDTLKDQGTVQGSAQVQRM